MPIYEYRCPSCGHEFEKLMKFNAPPPACPACGEAEVSKLVSASGFILKGSGWYKDHYGLKGGDSKKSSDGKKASDSKPAKSADAAKPAAKPDSGK